MPLRDQCHLDLIVDSNNGKRLEHSEAPKLVMLRKHDSDESSAEDWSCEV